MDKSHAQQIIRQIYNNELISMEDIKWVCSQSTQLFLDEPTVLDISSPVTVVGDVHGQIDAVLHIFDEFGSPKKKQIRIPRRLC